uniref:Uncharacterized protein n=1 Tax=Oryza rufipogon TaxID=4529 RepID=A0A0E0QPY7_ORYRU
MGGCDLAFVSRPKSTMAERLLYGRDVAFAPYGEYWCQECRICVLFFRCIREEEVAVLVERVRHPCRGRWVRARC